MGDREQATLGDVVLVAMLGTFGQSVLLAFTSADEKKALFADYYHVMLQFYLRTHSDRRLREVNVGQLLS